MATYHVLLPIDTDLKRGRAQAEAVVALPAAAEAVEVTLLHVFPDGEDVSPDARPTAADRVTEFLTQERSVAGLETELRAGDPASEIIEAAESLDVDAVVLGGRKRSPMGSLIFGSTTTDVLSHADRPVMITGDELVNERGEGPRPEEDEPANVPPGKGISEDQPLNPRDSSGTKLD